MSFFFQKQFVADLFTGRVARGVSKGAGSTGKMSVALQVTCSIVQVL